MSTPVYNQAPTVQNRPYGRLDAQGRVIPSSFNNMAYQADLNDTSYPVYIGYARPGASTSDPVWQIQKLTYTSDVVTAITWPQDVHGSANNDYQFIWENRTSYTYS